MANNNDNRKQSRKLRNKAYEVLSKFEGTHMDDIIQKINELTEKVNECCPPGAAKVAPLTVSTASNAYNVSNSSNALPRRAANTITNNNNARLRAAIMEPLPRAPANSNENNWNKARNLAAASNNNKTANASENNWNKARNLAAASANAPENTSDITNEEISAALSASKKPKEKKNRKSRKNRKTLA